MAHSKFYKLYLKTAQWRARSAACLARARNRCQECGRPGSPRNPLQAHHLHYRSLGNESPADLQCLCKQCHRRADTQRRRITKLQRKRFS